MEQLIAQLREAAGYLWPEIVYYTRVNALAGMVGYGTSLILLIYLNAVVWAYARNVYDEGNHERIDTYAIPTVTSVASVIVGFFLFTFFVNSIVAFVAPEGAAVMKMLQVVK